MVRVGPLSPSPSPHPTQVRSPLSAITKNHFNFQYCVGRGGFGKVWKVEKKKNKKLFAMKEMSKARIISKRSVNSVMNERKLLSQLKHPFLVNMSYAFQDQKNLYLIMDLLSGGDLEFRGFLLEKGLDKAMVEERFGSVWL